MSLMSHLQRSSIGVRACTFVLVTMFALLPLLASAQESKPASNVSTAWYMWPKAGDIPQFEKALREHAAWRKKAGEDFTWNIYQPVAGDDISYYVVFSGNHSWADFDRNQKWEMDNRAQDAFNQNVGPLVERYSHYFYEDEADLSYWPATGQFPMYAVTRMKLGPGQYGNFRSGVSSAREAAEAQKFGGNWELRSITGGDDDMMLVIPYSNYADMAGPSPSFMEMMAKHMGGEDQAAKNMTAIQSAIEAGNTTLVIHRPDLSTPAD